MESQISMSESSELWIGHNYLCLDGVWQEKRFIELLEHIKFKESIKAANRNIFQSADLTHSIIGPLITNGFLAFRNDRVAILFNDFQHQKLFSLLNS